MVIIRPSRSDYTVSVGCKRTTGIVRIFSTFLCYLCAPTLERPRTRSVKYGDRAFSAAAPALWNGLPAHIRCAKTLDNFKKLLKTYFFRQAFDES